MRNLFYLAKFSTLMCVKDWNRAAFEEVWWGARQFSLIPIGLTLTNSRGKACLAILIQFPVAFDDLFHSALKQLWQHDPGEAHSLPWTCSRDVF